MKLQPKSDIPTSIWICIYLWIAVIAANVPARIALAAHQAQFGLEPIAFTITGLTVDSIDWILIFLLINLLVAGLTRVFYRKRFACFGDTVIRTIVPTTMILFAIVMLGAIWATEHRIERGLYPTLFEFSNSLDMEFALAATKVFALDRFRFTPWISLAIVALSSVGIVIRLKKHPLKTPALISLSTLGCSVIFGLCFAWHGLASFVIPSIPAWKTIWSPGRIFISYGVKRQGIRHGSISLFHRLRLPNHMLAPGAEVVGLGNTHVDMLLPNEHAAQQTCHPHPLAQQLPSSPPLADGFQPYNKTLAASIDELSRQLFQQRHGPIRVWLVMLESFRGDDVHALHERAPRNVTPFMNRLFDEAAKPLPSVAAAKFALQAGNRTSHALGALVCGLGTMPYGLSASRDIGLLPLRCLSDVLKDAGFRPGYYYGSNPSYDNMLEFLNYHGFYHMKTGKQFVETSSFSGWGVLDHAVFMQSFEDSNQTDPAQSQFNLLMSLTNHFPFQRPTDIPEKVEARLHEAIDSQKLTSDDIARLTTLAYSDWAFEQFVTEIRTSAQAQNTIIFAIGDHTTTERFLWRNKGEKLDSCLPYTRVPFVIIVPDALIDASQDPTGVRKALAAIRHDLFTTPISQNDVPLFILRTLLHSDQIKSLAPALRWHTIGGQRLSPTFRVHEHQEAVVMGIDGFSKVFVADQHGSTTQLPYEAIPTVDVEVAMRQDPTLLPAAALVSAMMRGYASRCWNAQVIRKQL